MELVVLVLFLQILQIGAEGTPKTDDTTKPSLALKYGDIISIKGAYPCCDKAVTYSHYGIYLDKKRFEDQREGENMFTLLPEHYDRKYYTVFLNTGNDTLTAQNYLDNTEGFKDNPRTEADITGRITKIHNTFKEGIFNNKYCPENVPTFVRYGVSISLRGEQVTESCKMDFGEKPGKFDKKEEMERMENFKKRKVYNNLPSVTKKVLFQDNLVSIKIRCNDDCPEPKKQPRYK